MGVRALRRFIVFRAADGTLMQGTGFSSIDVEGLAAATDAGNVEFNLASGVSSSRRQGKPMSTENLIEITGADLKGQPLQTRHAVIHPAGAAALTGLSVAMLLERLLGLDGQPPTRAGLYFPYQLFNADAYLQRLKQEGGASCVGYPCNELTQSGASLSQFVHQLHAL